MKNQHILITGGAGFIGTHLATALKAKNKVTVIDLKKGQLKNVKYIQKPYHQLKALPQADIIYHLAWDSTPASSQPMAAEQKSNIKPSAAFIALAKKQNLKHFIFMSSAGAVYGRIKTPFKETQTPKPTNNYGKAKLVVENILKTQASKNFKITVIRATNVIGPGQVLRKNQGVIPALINCQKNNQVFELWGNSQKDYLSIGDLISALIASKKQQSNFEIFNVGSGIVLSVKDIIKLLEKSAGNSLNIKEVSSKIHDVDTVKVDISKIKSILNWQPKINIKDIIASLC